MNGLDAFSVHVPSPSDVPYAAVVPRRTFRTRRWFFIAIAAEEEEEEEKEEEDDDEAQQLRCIFILRTTHFDDFERREIVKLFEGESPRMNINNQLEILQQLTSREHFPVPLLFSSLCRGCR